MASRFAAFAGTLGGKVVVGTVAMAATVGALHSAGAVDVPILPDGGQTSDEPPQTGDDHRATGDNGTGPSASPAPDRQTTGDADPGQRKGQRQGPATTRPSPAEEYQEKVRDWNDCVAAAQSDPNTRSTGGIDPRAACGPKPNPADFGLGEETPQNPAPDSGATAEGPPEQPPVPDSLPPAPGEPTDQDSDPRGTGSGKASGGATGPEDAPGKSQRPLDTPAGRPHGDQG